MWPRVVEIMLGCWLMASPFIFRYPAEAMFQWVNDYSCAGLIILFASLSNLRRIEKIHLLNLLIGAWLIAVSYAQSPAPPPPPFQNYMMLGLTLLVFGILPSHSSEPPRKWKAYYGDNWGNL